MQQYNNWDKFFIIVLVIAFTALLIAPLGVWKLLELVGIAK